MSARRIVSLVPSLSETLCDLGLQSELVGCTTFCVHPAALRKTAVAVGGTKDANLEKILALNPTHILADTEENSKELLAALGSMSEAKGFTVLEYFPIDVVDSIEMVVDIAARFGASSKIDTWRAEVDASLASIERLRILAGAKTYCYFIWRNPWMVAGDKTYIAKMLNLIGWQSNIVTTNNPSERYPVIDPSDLRVISANNLLFSSEPFPFRKRHIEEFLNIVGPFSGRVLKVDGQRLSWYGTRTLQGLRYLIQLAENTLHENLATS